MSGQSISPNGVVKGDDDLEFYINTFYSTSFDLLSGNGQVLKTVNTTSTRPTYLISLDGDKLVMNFDDQKVFSLPVKASSGSYIDIKPGFTTVGYMIQLIENGKATDILEIRTK